MSVVDAPRAKEFIQLLRTRVSEKTMSHCVFTAEYFASFAEQAGVSHDQAVAAGLLHDLWKGAGDEELLAAARKYGIEPSAIQKSKPSMLHGAVAAEECRRELNVGDAVSDAIRWHTTGCMGLNKVGLGLYVADFSEPTRSFPEAAEARRLMRKEGFEAALRYVADEKLKHVRTKPDIDQTTEAFHAWLESVLP